MKSILLIMTCIVVMQSCWLTDKNRESFDDFFEKFSTDTVFQKTRLDRPIKVISYTRDEEAEKMMDIHYVSFSQKDWDHKIILQKERISEDTVTVTLEVKDTGILIDHAFARRNGRWFLFQIENHAD